MKYLFALVCSLVFMMGCSRPPLQTPISETRYSKGTLLTVEHDGHKWAIFKGFKAGGLAHHPDCSCLK